MLDPGEAARLRETMAEPSGESDAGSLSPEGRAVYRLLTRTNEEGFAAAIAALPPGFRNRLEALSPMGYLADLRTPLIVLMHDRDDPVIPRTESLQLRDVLRDHPGLRHTEFVLFKHLDPSKVHLALLPLLRELGRFSLALYPIFRRAAG